MRDMNVNNKVIYSTLILISSLGAASADTPAPQSYKSNGNFQPVTLVSSVNANGKVAITSYKGSDGNWHDTTPIAQICSVDSTGSPLLCPPYIDGQTVVNNLLNKASGIAGLDASGNLVAPLSTTGEIHGGMVAQAYYPQTNLTIPATNAISTGDNLGYHILDDRSVLLGGRSYADSAPTFIYAAPYGGSSLGSTLAVAMTKRGVGGEQVAMAPLVLMVGAEFRLILRWMQLRLGFLRTAPSPGLRQVRILPILIMSPEPSHMILRMRTLRLHCLPKNWHCCGWVCML